MAIKLCDALGRLGISSDTISTDAFMKNRTERSSLGISGYNPRSIDVHELGSALSQFASREAFGHHPYDNSTGMKQVRPRVVEPCDVLVVEGIHAFHLGIANRINLRVFLDSDEATLRRMRYRANIQKRGMEPADAAAKIESEWQDYCAVIRPLIPTADLVAQVDERFNYRWFISPVGTGMNSNPIHLVPQ